MKSILISFYLFVLIIMIQSCSNDNCPLIAIVEHDTFGLEIKDDISQDDLFFGDDAVYSVDEFEVFVKSSDTLKKYFRWSTFENSFTITGNRINDNLKDTFYLRIPNTSLDTLMVGYNQEDLGRCYGLTVTSYDLRLNENTVCEGCTLGETTILYK